MAALKRTCPACNVIFDAPAPGAASCPVCGAQWSPAPPAVPAPVPGSSGTGTEGRGARGSGWWFALAALGFLAGGVLLALPHLMGAGQTPAPAPAVVQVVIPPPPDLGPGPLPDVQPPAPALSPRPDLHRETPKVAAPAPAGPLSVRVNEAIDRGVGFLKRDGERLRLPQRYEGLLGLALLECDVPPQDPLIQRIAASLRRQEGQLHGTYELSLAVLFFDRLGRGADRALIRTFAQRLTAGQNADGGWSYPCPLPRPPRPVAIPPQLGVAPAWPSKGTPSRPAPGSYPSRRADRPSDQSNTQFAVLALWVAQRHGVYTVPALARVDGYFRKGQKADGGWAYRHALPRASVANTCSGLLALAAGHGISARAGREAHLATPFGPANDTSVAAAFEYLGHSLYGGSKPGAVGSAARTHHPLYTLWSLERAAVVYDLKVIGDREWYPWAAEAILLEQRPDGAWVHGHGEVIDTCFALLVLRRSNLVPDLTEALRGGPTARRPAPPPDFVGGTGRKPLSPSGPMSAPSAELLEGVTGKPRSAAPPGGLREAPPVPPGPK